MSLQHQLVLRLAYRATPSVGFSEARGRSRHFALIDFACLESYESLLLRLYMTPSLRAWSIRDVCDRPQVPVELTQQTRLDC
jgi:hypothetical protein